MSFRGQVRAAVLGGLACGVLALLAAAAGPGAASDWLYGALALAALVLLVGGGAARTLARWSWFGLSRPSAVLAGAQGWLVTASPLGPLLRWYLHLDETGADRDGLA